jgi:class 3 adenylate cyclase/tetratricopeptide (TPR) repeat protein
MRCLRCGFDSPLPTRYCGGCGHLLVIACGTCAAENPADFRFCGSCGASLPIATLPPTIEGESPVTAACVPAPASDDVPEPAGRPAERRQLTVMFCDLVGSTSLSALLDPEELRDVVRAYQGVAAEVIERYEGYIAQYLGDGILAYFGFPRALEDEAGRAVRAGRELVAAIRNLNETVQRPEGFALSARVGIHTGLVVTGEIGAGSRREHLALGETPNVAARIQAAAEPDQVVVSGETYSLVRSDFVFERLGTKSIRGIAQAVELYRADGEQAIELSRGQRATAPGTLVGREEELGRLERTWERATTGAGEVVLLGGDTGLGKTALSRAFARRIAAEGSRVISGRCLPYFHGSPLEPMAELMRRWIEMEARAETQGAARGTRELLRGLLDRYGMADSLPLLASLVGLRNREREARSAEPEPQWRERTGEALAELIIRATGDGPILMCIEDVHWADPSTMELLGELVARIPDHPLLAVLTHRPGFRSPWGAADHKSELALTRLGHQDAEALIDLVTGGKPLPGEVVTRILERTDGVPFFVEELTRMVLESGLVRETESGYEMVSDELPPLAIPLTLHDSLEARLERLSSSKETAQLGAVLGREFSFELIRAVAETDEAALAASLERLVEADLLVRSGTGRSAVYAFKHALIQEVAYQSLLRGVRQTHHLRAARVLESRFADRAAENPEILAQHYAGAGMPELAVEQWARAGRRAVERSAHREAILHLRQGVDLLRSMPDGSDRRDRELQLLLTLGPALIATHGHAAAAVRDTYARAHELAAEDTDLGRRFEILTGLVTACFVRAEMLEAREAAEEMVQLARRMDDPGRAMAASIALGITLLGAGAVEEALRRLEAGIAAYDPDRDFNLTHLAGQDFGVLGMAYSAYALCALGRPARAVERVEEALRLARSLRHPHTLAFALSFACSVAYFRRDPEMALAPLEELIALARRERFPHWLFGAAALQAWVAAERGDGPGAIARLAEPDAVAAAGGAADIQLLFWRCVAGEVFLRAGRPEEALPLLDEVVRTMASRPTRLWWAAEAYRLRARAHASRGDVARAADDLSRAAEEAAAAGASLFLLRALVDRARLAPHAPEATEAARALSRLYPTLPETHDLPDLRSAHELLDQVGAPAPTSSSVPVPPAPLP